MLYWSGSNVDIIQKPHLCTYTHRLPLQCQVPCSVVCTCILIATIQVFSSHKLSCSVLKQEINKYAHNYLIINF